jgi:hypothetical protein
MTETKTCRHFDAAMPLAKFRVLPPRQPGHSPTIHSLCLVCEREAARVRAAKRYNTERLKQIANAAVQVKRQRMSDRPQQAPRPTGHHAVGLRNYDLDTVAPCCASPDRLTSETRRLRETMEYTEDSLVSGGF